MTQRTRPKVTVYTPSHNYGRYLSEAVESIIHQTMPDWELIIILDGAVDESEQVAARYQALHPDRIRVISNDTPRGLQFNANLAIHEARGDYVMRLDADDWLDENALLVMSHYLDTHRDKALVYPNYIYVDEAGEIMEVDTRKKIGREVDVLDLPAHGACTMIRKRVLKTVGGYSEDFTAQDGYDIWLRIVQRFPIGNVTTPLFYYRQHGTSLSKDEKRVLEARQRIHRFHASNGSGKGPKPRIVGIVGAKNAYQGMPGLVLRPVGGRPLIDHTLAAALEADVFDRILVTTDDPEVAAHCQAFDPRIDAFLRDRKLSQERTHLETVVLDAVTHLEHDAGFFPDIVVFLNSHAPLRTAEHILAAIDNLLLYNTDSVVSVYEDFDLHYTHGRTGLQPMAKDRHTQLRVEREALYVDNRAVLVAWRDVLSATDMKGAAIGQMVMPYHDSFHIKTARDIDLLDLILTHRAGARGQPEKVSNAVCR